MLSHHKSLQVLRVMALWYTDSDTGRLKRNGDPDDAEKEMLAEAQMRRARAELSRNLEESSAVEGSRWLRWRSQTDMKVLKTARLWAEHCLLVLNINSSHLSVPMPTMNNRGSAQLCQHSELFIHNPRLALADSARCSPPWGAGEHFARSLSHRKWKSGYVHMQHMHAVTFLQAHNVRK